MLGRQAARVGVALALILAGCVLIDGWFIEDGYIDPDGEGPVAPIPSFEIAAKNRPIEVDVDTAPPVPLCVETSTNAVEVPTPEGSVRALVRPRPVDPAGWLGRRHLRSPT